MSVRSCSSDFLPAWLFLSPVVSFLFLQATAGAAPSDPVIEHGVANVGTAFGRDPLDLDALHVPGTCHSGDHIAVNSRTGQHGHAAIRNWRWKPSHGLPLNVSVQTPLVSSGTRNSPGSLGPSVGALPNSHSKKETKKRTVERTID